MANKAQLGEIRTWKDGRKYQKTANGWVPVKSGSKGNTEQKEEPAKGRSSKESEGSGQDYQIKQGAWNEDIPVKNLPYGKGDVSYLKERFPDAKVSAYIDDENEDYEVSVSLPSKNGDVDISIFDDGQVEISYKDGDGESVTQEANLYYDDDLDEVLMNAGVFDEDDAPENPENDSSNENQSYSPEQLADYAKSASDEGLKRAASSGDEQMRVAAKKEIARRKNEGMESDTDNPFDKGTVQKSQREERIFKGQVYEKVDGGWVKKMSDALEKGKVGQLGEIRTWGGKKYQKTAKGWRPVKKIGGSKDSSVVESKEEKSLKADNDWVKTIREYTACGGGNFGKVLEKKPNGDLVVEYIRRGEKPWTDIAKKGSEDWKHLKDEKPSMQKKSSDITEDFDSYFEKIMDKLSESKNLKADVDKVGGAGTFEHIMKETDMRRWEDGGDRRDYIWMRIHDVLLDKVYDKYKEKMKS